MKTLLILALLLFVMGIKAQNEYDWELYFNIGFGLGVSDSKQELKPSYNWQESFNNGIAHFKQGEGNWFKKENLFKVDFLLGIEPKAVGDNFELGFPVNFYFGSARKTSTKIMLPWENHIVKLKDIVIKAQSPSFGISTGFGWDHKFWLQLLTYNYKLIERNYRAYRDADYYYTDVADEKELENNWAQKLIIGYGYDTMDERGRISLYLERAGKYFEIGILFEAQISSSKGSTSGGGYRPCPYHDCY